MEESQCICFSIKICIYLKCMYIWKYVRTYVCNVCNVMHVCVCMYFVCACARVCVYVLYFETETSVVFAKPYIFLFLLKQF